jgi:type II secretory pathway pseudopilin PulG
MRLENRCGQSLVEILIGMAIGISLIIAGIGLIVPALNSNKQVSNIQIGTALARELLDNTRVWSERDWHNILSLATGTANRYYLITTASPYASSSGSQTITVSTTTYTRYFYVSDGYRDASGNITASGGTYDPSTKLITVAYGWPGVPTSTMSMYLTRNEENIYLQSDWSGGPGASSAATSVGNQFATSSNIDYSTTTGSLYLNIPGY